MSDSSRKRRTTTSETKSPEANVSKAVPQAPEPGRKVAANSSAPRPVRRSQPSGITSSKMLVILSLMVLAFFGAYNFASSQGTAGAAGVSQGGGVADIFAAAPAGGGCGMSGGAGGAGGGCCGGGGAPVEGATTVEGAVQKVDVDTSQGSFAPNIIKAKAGVPIVMNFSQAPGGCLSGVLFPDFNISEDLTAGPKTIELPALEPGEYAFYCQMQMVSATIVVE